MKQIPLLLISGLLIIIQANAQDAKTTWDDTSDKTWPQAFTIVDIPSSADGSIQKARFYPTQQPTPQPLIISLHTWSGDYDQEDPLANEILLRKWNYIHPDFRGPNTRPEACGSELVIPDIEDAIRFAINQGKVDITEVHIIGVSGGGYATLLSFMKLRYPIKSFHAWASISDLEDWYWECKARDLKYAKHLEQVTTQSDQFDAEEARKRSPLYMAYPAAGRKDAQLTIYAGLHDGYTGSVPITHSINMYNKLLEEIYPGERYNQEKVSDKTIINLLSKRMQPAPDTSLYLGGRKVHLLRKTPRLSLLLFEGGHEMIVPQALSLLPINNTQVNQKLNILTIGDSNGAVEEGWPEQLRKLLPYSTIINTSISGNTIGFDNLDQEKLNSLKNIEDYLQTAVDSLTDQNLDYIILGLGTNDTKQIFAKRQDEVAENMETLIQKIQSYQAFPNQHTPEIIILTPPPMDESKINKEKYGGGDQRIRKNNKKFMKLAKEYDCTWVNSYALLEDNFSSSTTDGVHLNEKAQFRVAQQIINELNPSTPASSPTY
ncbi:SGNH/GDSL hydrolase family protein [Catalinimonas niigatensis]|uniref:SGNH/GDSL hydrolase family protein n=1 Tax=Catalinimonas niigatensis TaxID=1397264 RepID=UPI00266712A2|nr:GDSL-type esterase/lipase family protein [Catalinimonas niigatensis]WPP52703.1 GDSL-type esterase/lipase family protein [Catalinimonas niigatensis]